MRDEPPPAISRAEGFMNAAPHPARDEAIAWAIRAHAESFDDWDALAEWLAADPHHAELYDQASIAAEEGLPLVLEQEPKMREPAAILPFRRRPSRWLATGLAASIVAAVGGAWMAHQTPRPDLYAVATKPGETRDIQIDGTVRIALDGGSRIILDRHDPRTAVLEAGEALFSVSHDARHPFRMRVGDATITDVGTVFDVERADRVTTVSVAEGAVQVAAAGSTTEAKAGQAVMIDAPHHALVRRDQDPQVIGSWRHGRIDFADITMTQLAARLHRATGQTMRVVPELGGRRVSGSVEVGSDTAETLRQLSGLLDISIGRQGDTWVWSKAAGAG